VHALNIVDFALWRPRWNYRLKKVRCHRVSSLSDDLRMEESKEKRVRTSAAFGTFLKSGCKCLFPWTKAEHVGKRTHIENIWNHGKRRRSLALKG
jgi:hypothetical protein